jgi:hypothetical protein
MSGGSCAWRVGAAQCCLHCCSAQLPTEGCKEIALPVQGAISSCSLAYRCVERVGVPARRQCTDNAGMSGLLHGSTLTWQGLPVVVSVARSGSQLTLPSSTGAWTGSPGTLGGGCYMGMCVARAARVHWCPASTAGGLQAAVSCPEPACAAAVAMPDGVCRIWLTSRMSSYTAPL